MTVGDVARVLGPLSSDPTSRLSTALGGDGISKSDHVLMLLNDHLAAANWQRGGGKKKDKPDPLSPLAKRSGGKRRFGQTDLPPEEAIALLRAANPRED